MYQQCTSYFWLTVTWRNELRSIVWAAFQLTLLNGKLHVRDVNVGDVRQPDVDPRQVATFLRPQKPGVLDYADDVVGADFRGDDGDEAVVDVNPLSRTEDLHTKQNICHRLSQTKKNWPFVNH